MKAVTDAGIDLDDVFAALEDEGIQKFAGSWDELTQSVRSELEDKKLAIVTGLARDYDLPFRPSEYVADLYRQALHRYGSADGEPLAVALLEEQACLRQSTRQPRADQVIQGR